MSGHQNTMMNHNLVNILDNYNYHFVILYNKLIDIYNMQYY